MKVNDCLLDTSAVAVVQVSKDANTHAFTPVLLQIYSKQSNELCAVMVTQKCATYCQPMIRCIAAQALLLHV